MRGRDGGAELEPRDVAAVRSSAGGASRSFVLAPIPFDPRQCTSAIDRVRADPGSLAASLHRQGAAVAYAIRPGPCSTSEGRDDVHAVRSGVARTVDKAGARADRTQGGTAIVEQAAGGLVVRRLTPRECERLQGLPDDWTAIPYRGRPVAADTSRFAAIGNAFPPPMLRWIGERIAIVDGALASA